MKNYFLSKHSLAKVILKDIVDLNIAISIRKLEKNNVLKNTFQSNHKAVSHTSQVNVIKSFLKLKF